MDAIKGGAEELLARLEAAGQGHVLRFWDELDGAGRALLLGQVSELDFQLLDKLRGLLNDPATDAGGQDDVLEPPDLFPLELSPEREAEAKEARRQGTKLLTDGLVGYVLVAGGQGSRLGFDGPKGMYPAGPVSGLPLFDWHARRILAARQRYGAIAPWYVMTSPANDAATREYFAQRDHFGLGADNIFFFTQAMLPALDTQGRIVLAAKDRLFLAPNGHGGSLAALADSGALGDAKRRGVEVFSYFQVDNPLARPADPLFLGLHVLEGSDMSTKVVSKRDAGEKVGVIGKRGGKLGCIEYSDLTDALRHAQDGAGQLLFRAGNIAVHAIDRRFVEELTDGELALPWHLARKALDTIDDAGEPTKKDGIKFETFVFDALGKAQRSVTLEVDRRLEFSPIKNAQGEDSPASSRRDLTRLFAGWVRKAAAPIPEAGDDGLLPIEVDPTFAEDEGEFLARMPADPKVSGEGQLWR